MNTNGMKLTPGTQPSIARGLACLLIGALLLAGCASEARVGALQTESLSVELGEAEAVRVDIVFGAGDLAVAGGAEKLLEADFTYNVARLKPEVKYSGGTLAIRQPEVRGVPALRDMADFRNAWRLRLYDAVPMDLRVTIGAGTSDLQLAGLSLTRLDITLGAGLSTIDLSGDWPRDLDVTIESGAADVRLLLPGEVGARVDVEAGPTTIQAAGLSRDGGIYTNAAYGQAAVTLRVNMEAGIGRISLAVED
jgi:hypothetical protein